MELNFLYNDGSHLKKISFNATEITDQTFLMSQVGGYRDGTKNVGWCPKINNLTFRSTEPRYFGTTGYRSQLMGTGITGDYSRFFPNALVNAINKFPTENTYTLTTSSNFLGTKTAGSQYYNGVPLLREVDGAYKKVCNLLWAYIPQPIPGQDIHAYVSTGFWGFSYPSDEFPNGTMYNPTADRNEHQFTTEFPEVKMSLWIITVQDDVTGSVSYGREYKLLAQVLKMGANSISNFVSFIDLRLLNGADEEGQPIPNGSEPKKNSTPKGWSGNRSTASSSDTPTVCPDAIKYSVNFGEFGIHLYECSNENINDLSGIIFNESVHHLFDNWDPKSGILSLHKLPYEPETMVNEKGERTAVVHIAGREAYAQGTKYKPLSYIGDVEDYVYECYGTFIAGGQNKTSVTKQIYPFFGSFLDFEPYTKIQVRLPFIGTVSVPTSACMGGEIKVNYILDNRNGNCVAQILCKSMRNLENEDSNGFIIIGQYSGNCAMPAAICGNTTGGEARIGAVRGFASSAVAMGAAASLGAITGPVAAAGVIGSAVNAGVNYATAPTSPDIIGSINCEAACMEDLTVRVLITRPVDVTPGDFKVVDGERVFTASSLLDQKGFASYSGGTVGQYNGMTIGYIRGAIEGATETEMIAIKNAFLGGVIV